MFPYRTPPKFPIELGCTVGVVSRVGAGWSRVWILAGAREVFFLSPRHKTFTLVLELTKFRIQWVPGFLPMWWNDQCGKFTIPFHLVLSLGMCGAVLLLPHLRSMHRENFTILPLFVITITFICTLSQSSFSSHIQVHFGLLGPC